MKLITAIIVDDETRARRVLRSLIKKSQIKIEILAECVDVTSAVGQIKLLKPQVVFLDVQMPNYAGYEIINFFDEIDFEIIFVTAFDDYAIKAFDLCAIDYLVKPIDRNRLYVALEKLNVKLEQQDKIEKYTTLLNSIKSKEFTKIILPELGNRRIFDLKTIIAVEADGAYSKIYSTGNESTMVSKNLKYFENTLPRNDNFFRSHRSWIVNLNYVKSINKTKGDIHLEANIVARLSRNRYSEFELSIS